VAPVYPCPTCEGLIEKGFRYCPWCGGPQRLKLVEFFPPHRGVSGDHDKALRVSRYLGSSEEERHVRFSVWGGEGEAKAAVSLAEAEADKLAEFLLRSGRRRTLEFEREPAGEV
jgi:hypothetical protein